MLLRRRRRSITSDSSPSAVTRPGCSAMRASPRGVRGAAPADKQGGEDPGAEDGSQAGLGLGRSQRPGGGQNPPPPAPQQRSTLPASHVGVWSCPGKTGEIHVI